MSRKVIHDDEGRVCTICLIYKPWKEFYKNKSGFLGHTNACQECTQLTRKSKAHQHNKQAKRTNKQLKKDNYAKWKARLLRSSWRERSIKFGLDPSLVPSTTEIAAWIDAQRPWYCYFSGEKLNAKNMGFDHLIPLNRGGHAGLDNVRMCSRLVNSAKGIMTEQEFSSLLSLMSTWEDKGKSLLGRLRYSNRMY